MLKIFFPAEGPVSLTTKKEKKGTTSAVVLPGQEHAMTTPTGKFARLCGNQRPKKGGEPYGGLDEKLRFFAGPYGKKKGYHMQT